MQNQCFGLAETCEIQIFADKAIQVRAAAEITVPAGVGNLVRAVTSIVLGGVGLIADSGHQLAGFQKEIAVLHLFQSLGTGDQFS